MTKSRKKRVRRRNGDSARKNQPSRWSGAWARISRWSGAFRGPAAVWAARGVTLAAVTFGGVFGVMRLEAHVLSEATFEGTAEVVLLDVPEGMTDTVMEVVRPAAEGSWSDPALCRRIWSALGASAWVAEVRAVRRFANGRVVVSCDYRIPAALVDSGGSYYLVDAKAVRLPGVYGYDPSLVAIQGAKCEPPESGRPWPGDDVPAAMKLLGLLRVTPFFDEVTGIVVDNYDGKRDPLGARIELAVAPGGSRIGWGSAPGEEIEENSAAQKIALLTENFRRWGRLDAGRNYIDIATFRDALTVADGQGG